MSIEYGPPVLSFLAALCFLGGSVSFICERRWLAGALCASLCLGMVGLGYYGLTHSRISSSSYCLPTRGGFFSCLRLLAVLSRVLCISRWRLMECSRQQTSKYGTGNGS